ncbi:hypothetical protein NKG94_07605 [Micromonospora sp. M12]
MVTGPGQVDLVEQEAGLLRPGTFRVETLFSGVSAGTELSYVKGTNPYSPSPGTPTSGCSSRARRARRTRSPDSATCRSAGWWRAPPRPSRWARSAR